MRKLVQDLEKGRMRLMEVPVPKPDPNEVLVKVHYSAISPGTEGKTVRDARKGYLAKARARRAELQKVIRTAREQGVLKTYRMVKDRLKAPSPLGYSCSGEVVECGDKVNELRPGDRVACGGTKAGHAEWVAVPRILCAKVPENVPSEEAAFTTLGAIALQGIRRSRAEIGSKVLVIGGGTIGILSAFLLKQGGMEPILVDPSEERLKIAEQAGIEHCFPRALEDLEARIEKLTGNFGVDAALITAATPSTDPVDLAGRVSRQKGTVVMLGDSGTGFERRDYYRKELELRMSHSYGPGRKDPAYEEKGQDYPIGEVRWTENRNMQSFLELLAKDGTGIRGLITHRFPFERAPEAYGRILEADPGTLGVLLEYSQEKETPVRVQQNPTKRPKSRPRIGLIGGGSFARNILLPALPKDAHPTHITTRDPSMARYLAEKYDAERYSSDPEELIADEELDCLIIATRHDSHAEWTEKGLKAGKDIFVEKPLCLNREELDRIEKAYGDGKGRLMVGFNRRFAPLYQRMAREWDPDAPKSIRIEVNASKLPTGHWVHDPEIGGGRIRGEVCHFIDLITAIAGSPITELSGQALEGNGHPPDTLTAGFRTKDGSIASLSYSSEGSQLQAKERVEVHQNGRSFVLKDFQRLESMGQRKRKKHGRVDKGHKGELEAWIRCLREGEASPIPFEVIRNSTLASFLLEEAVRNGGSHKVEE